MNRSLSTITFRSLLLTVALAAPVCAQNLTTFVNGQPANAVQVNANFEALKTTVQSAQAAAGAAQFTADAAQTTANAAATQASVSTLNTTVANLSTSLSSLTSALTGAGVNVAVAGFVQAFGFRLLTTNRFEFGPPGENSDDIWFERSNEATNVSRLRLVIGDDPGTSFTDRFEVGTLTTTFNPVLTMLSNGNVGIGTGNPTAARLVVSAGPPGGTLPQHGFLLTTGAGAAGASAFGEALSISASGCVHAQLFRALSDARIKSIVGRSDGPRDLDTLMGIEITDYTHKDTVTKGGGTHKKVIAQQVEAVYPQAVGRSTDVVPDIYQRATQQDGWITLATDLKVGERVRLIGENAEGVHEVLEVRDGAFRTGFVPAGEKVFVYGREVNDFRSVDYEAIAMLNVSASQELARRVEALTAENTALKNRVASLEAMAAEVAALKAAMQPLLAK